MPAARHPLSESADEDGGAVVRAVRTRPGRIVFTADGAPDAWIATDLLVETRD